MAASWSLWETASKARDFRSRLGGFSTEMHVDAGRLFLQGFAYSLVVISRNVNLNLVDARSPTNIERFVVGIAKREICKSLGH